MIPRHQSSCSQMMIGVSNHLLSMVFRFHYHSDIDWYSPYRSYRFFSKRWVQKRWFLRGRSSWRFSRWRPLWKWSCWMANCKTKPTQRRRRVEVKCKKEKTGEVDGNLWFVWLGKTYPPKTNGTPLFRNKGLIRETQCLISPDHKAIFLGRTYVRG